MGALRPLAVLICPKRQEDILADSPHAGEGRGGRRPSRLPLSLNWVMAWLKVPPRDIWASFLQGLQLSVVCAEVSLGIGWGLGH